MRDIKSFINRTVKFLTLLCYQIRDNRLRFLVVLISGYASIFVIFQIKDTMNAQVNQVGNFNELAHSYGIDFYEIKELKNFMDVFAGKIKSTSHHILEFSEEIPFEINIKFPPNLINCQSNNLDYGIIIGRDFSVDELINGKEVIILDQLTYNKYYNDKNINDDIKIGSQHFKLIGICSYEEECVNNVIPYQCLINQKVIKYRYGYFTMKKRLTKKDKNEIKSITENNEPISNSFYEMLSGTGMDIFFNLILCVIVLMIAIFNIVWMIRIINIFNKDRFYLYYLLGSQNITSRFINGILILGILILCLSLNLYIYPLFYEKLTAFFIM